MMLSFSKVAIAVVQCTSEWQVQMHPSEENIKTLIWDTSVILEPTVMVGSFFCNSNERDIQMYFMR